ncbi:MAG: type II secretion system protein [Planctomycetota bacterium]
MSRSAFTLIELVVVILIVAILSTAVVPVFRNSKYEASAVTILRNVRTIHQQAELIKSIKGSYPGDARPSAFPTDLEGFVAPGVFETKLPDGGVYDWNGEGVSGLPMGMSVLFPSTADARGELWQQLEAMADDGDASAGWIESAGLRIRFRLD